MTKVLLIFPTPSLSSPQKSPPLSILHVGEALRTKGDYRIAYADERYDSPQDISSLIQWSDVVGVSSMTGYQLGRAIHWLKLSKSFQKRTILGGVHATMQPEQCLDESYVDSIVTGPGESGIIEAIHGDNRWVNTSFRKVQHVSPVNEHTLLHFQRAAKSQDVILLTSRGCRFRCGFCFNQRFYDRQWSSVDLDRWQQDVAYLKERAGITKLEHGDDWIGPWSRAKEIIRFLHEQGIDYRPSMRANQITMSVAREMSELGLTHLSIGMESGSERILSLIKKDIVLEQQLKAAQALAHYKIHPMYYWIVGFPTETISERNQTFDLADRIEKIHHGNLSQVFYSYRATPGSSLWQMVDSKELPRTTEEWSHIDIGFTRHNALEVAIYQIGGLSHHMRRGDKTDQNFPGISRLAILPFELLAVLRWKLRYFKHFGIELAAINRLLKWASRRRE